MSKRKDTMEQIFESMSIIRRKFIMEGYLNNKNSSKNTFLELRQNQITPSQWGVLSILSKEENLSVKEIAEILCISSSAATQLIDELVNKGYLMRKEKNTDRRQVSVGLSRQHKKRMLKMKKIREKRLEALFQKLNAEELSQFAKLNKKIAEGVLNK